MSLSLEFTHSIQYLVHLAKCNYYNITKIILAVSVGVVFNHEALNGRGVETNVYSGLNIYNILTHSLQSPPQWQSAVHFKAALTHRQAFLHPFWQPQRNNSRVAWLASGMVVHTGYHCPKLDQPQLEGEGSSGASWRAVPQQYAPWNTLRLKWSRRASFVGGMSSIPRPFFTNSSIRAASTLLSKLVLLYNALWLIALLLWCCLDPLSLSGRLQWGCQRFSICPKLFSSLCWQRKTQYHSLYRHGT